VDWRSVDATPLFDTIRARGPAADAERAVWAFDEALHAARIDDELLDHLFVACACLIARRDGQSPRWVLEQTFRRSVSDEEWRHRFAPLIA
jgi:hypothetical protein